MNWNYDTPKAQVQDKLADDLGILNKALQIDPANHELRLLTGLVAHFAYNLNDEAAFQIATDNLSKGIRRGVWRTARKVAGSRKAIQALRLRLRLGLRQSGSARARGDYGGAEAPPFQSHPCGSWAVCAASSGG
jgi:hypothetical protein